MHFWESSKWVHRLDVQFYNSFVLPTHPAVAGLINFLIGQILGHKESTVRKKNGFILR
jgi:hypothetical protein